MGLNIHLHIYHHDADGKQLDRIEKKLDKMANELEVLTAEVAENKTVIGSAVVLLQGLKEKLDAAIGNPAALAALSAELSTTTDALAAAVAANTPAEPQP